jgi:hypothetical protein
MTRIYPAALAVLGLLAFTGGARADMGVPGFKWIDTLLSFDNLADFPDHVFFFVVPGWVTGERIHGPGRGEVPPRLSSGSPHAPGYALRWNREWMVVAVPRRQEEQAGPKLDWGALAASNPGVLHSNRLTLSPPQTLFFLHPKDSETYHFHLALADGRLTVTPGVVEGGYSIPTILAGLAITAAVIALGLWLRHRRRSVVAKVGGAIAQDHLPDHG